MPAWGTKACCAKAQRCKGTKLRNLANLIKKKKNISVSFILRSVTANFYSAFNGNLNDYNTFLKNIVRPVVKTGWLRTLAIEIFKPINTNAAFPKKISVINCHLKARPYLGNLHLMKKMSENTEILEVLVNNVEERYWS